MSNTTLRCDSYSSHSFLYDYSPAPAVDFTNGMASSTPINFANVTSFASEVEVADYAIPILIMVLGIVSVVIFQIMLFFRCCCACMKCGPDTFNHNREGWQNKIVKRRRLLYRLFYVFVVTALISDQITLYGSSEIDGAVENTQVAILNLRDITSSSIYNIGVINSTKYRIDAQYATSACYGGTNDYTLMRLNLTNEPIESFISMTENFPDTLTDAEVTLGEWGKTKKNSVVYVFYVFVLLICFLFFMSPLMQLKKLLQLCIFISEVVIIALSIIFSLEMILLNFLSDFCIDPMANTRALSGSMDIVTFYTSNNVTLTGLTNPLEDKIITIKEQYDITLADLTDKYNDASGPCYQEAAMAETIRLMGISESMIDAVSCSASFDAIAPELNTAFTEFCSGFFTGFTALWLQQGITSFLLFCLICVASVLYEFYGDWWDVDEKTEYPPCPEDNGQKGSGKVVPANESEV